MSSGEIANVHVSIGADTAKFKKGMKDAQDTMKGFGKQMSETASLSRNQMLEVTHVARAWFDMVVTGQDPLRALFIEQGRIAQIFAQGGIVRAIGSAASALFSFKGMLLTTGAAIVGSVASVALLSHSFGELEKRAKLAQVSMADLYKLEAINSRGDSGFKLDEGIQKFAAGLREAQVAGTGIAEVLKKNNIQIKDAAGNARNLNDVWRDVAARVSDANNEIDKVKFAENLGLKPEVVKSWEELNEAVKSGKDKLTSYESTMLALRVGARTITRMISDDWNKSTSTSGKAFDKMGTDWKATATSMIEWIALIAANAAEMSASVDAFMEDLPNVIGSLMRQTWEGLVSYTQDGMNSLVTAANYVREKLGLAKMEYFTFATEMQAASDKVQRSNIAGKGSLMNSSTYAETYKYIKDIGAEMIATTDKVGAATGKTQLHGIYEKAKKPVTEHKNAIEELIQKLRNQNEEFDKGALRMRIDENLRHAGSKATAEQRALIVGLTIEHQRLQTAQEVQIFTAQAGMEKLGRMTDFVKGQFTTWFDSAIQGTFDLRKAFADLASSIAKLGFGKILTGLFADKHALYGGDSGPTSFFKNLFGGAFAGLFAEGGNIGAGQFGIVGEGGGWQHAEIVKGPASVIPVSKLGGGGSNVSINIDARGADAGQIKLLQQQLYAMKKDFAGMVKGVTANERRNNPAFA